MVQELPVTLVQSVQRKLMTAVGAVGSPFTGSLEVQDWGGAWWEYDITMAVMTPENGRTLSAFLTALGGMRGSFIFRDPSMEPPQNIGAGVVYGANQTGSSLTTASWVVNSPLFKAGQFISVGTEATTSLHQVTADVASDGSGRATIPIVPRLRSPAPIANSAVEYARPALHLRLKEPVAVNISGAARYAFTITTREAT